MLPARVCLCLARRCSRLRRHRRLELENPRGAPPAEDAQPHPLQTRPCELLSRLQGWRRARLRVRKGARRCLEVPCRVGGRKCCIFSFCNTGSRSSHRQRCKGSWPLASGLPMQILWLLPGGAPSILLSGAPLPMPGAACTERVGAAAGAGGGGWSQKTKCRFWPAGTLVQAFEPRTSVRRLAERG